MDLVIVNPSAGHGRTKRVLEQIKPKLDASTEYDIWYTQYPFHATELAKQAAGMNRYERILSLGGDGTLREIAQGILYTDIGLGMIPAGTGNDFCKTLGIPMDIEQALEIALSGERRSIDTLMVDDKICLNIASAGFDARTVKNTFKFKRFVRGFLAYFFGVVQTFFSYRPIELNLELDDGTQLEKKAILICLANGKFYGGGFCPMPMADVTDGKMDIMVADYINRLSILRILPKFIRGKHVGDPRCAIFQCKSAQLRFSGEPCLNIDGEILEKNTCSVKLLEKSVNVIVKKEGA